MTENHWSNYEATVIDSWGAKFFYFGRCSPTLSDSSSRSLARLCPRPLNFFSQWKIQRKRTFTEFIYARLCPCSSQSMQVCAYIIIHTCLISIQSIDTHSLHWLGGNWLRGVGAKAMNGHEWPHPHLTSNMPGICCVSSPYIASIGSWVHLSVHVAKTTCYAPLQLGLLAPRPEREANWSENPQFVHSVMGGLPAFPCEDLFAHPSVHSVFIPAHCFVAGQAALIISMFWYIYIYIKGWYIMYVI